MVIGLCSLLCRYLAEGIAKGDSVSRHGWKTPPEEGRTLAHRYLWGGSFDFTKSTVQQHIPTKMQENMHAPPPWHTQQHLA